MLLRRRVTNGRWAIAGTTRKVAVIESGVSEKHGIKQETVQI